MTRGNQVWQKEAGKGKVSEMILKRMRSKQQGKKLMVWPFNIFLYKFHSIKKKSIQQLFAKFVSHVFQISLMFSKRAMNSPQNAIGVDTTLTNHKKNVQPEMNHARNVGKLDILLKCAEVGNAM